MRLPRCLGLMLLALVASSLPAPVTAQCEIEEAISASDGTAGELFGFEVAISGDVAVVCARGDDEACPGVPDCSSGSVYVYRQVGGDWIEEQKLLPSDGNFQQYFGTGVAVEGDVILVGAGGDDQSCPGVPECFSGAVYVFRNVAGVWVETQKIIPSDATSGQRFGISVAARDGTLLVGASSDSSGVLEAGAVYVFDFDGSNWIEQQKLVASDPAEFAFFGVTVAIDGDRMVVGSYFNGAYVFAHDGTTWSQEVKLEADGADWTLGFGHPAVIGRDGLGGAGEIVVVGSTPFFTAPLSAHVFRRVGAVWSQQQVLFGGGGFGSALHLSDGTLVVGANRDLVNADFDGSVSLYEYGGSEWSRTRYLPGSEPEGRLGASVALSGTALIAGRPTAGVGGSALIYDLSLSDCDGNGLEDNCDLAGGGVPDLDQNGIPDSCQQAFIRADVNSDGTLGLSDVLTTLNYLFGPLGVLSCEDAADADDDGVLGLIDPIFMLNYLFVDGAPPFPPFSACGVDATADGLGCDAGCP